MNKTVYIASGWFTDNTREILDQIEIVLESIPGLDVYSPRRDGTALTPNEFGNTEVRRKVFQDNVDNIKKADFLVVNLDGKDGHLDTGTVWELGMATALGVPVIGYENYPTDVLGGIGDSVDQWVLGFDQLRQKAVMFTETLPAERTLSQYSYDNLTTKALIIGPDTSQEHDRVNLDILAALNTHDVPTRLVDSPSIFSIDNSVADQIFDGISYMVAVVDDRHPAVAWAMGQAYIRNIPIISFTNHDYGVNLMLLLSIVRHVKGTENLIEFVKEIQEKGILKVDTVDYADVRAI